MSRPVSDTRAVPGVTHCECGGRLRTHDSRPTGGEARCRRKRCDLCKKVYTTWETSVAPRSLVAIRQQQRIDDVVGRVEAAAGMLGGVLEELRKETTSE